MQRFLRLEVEAEKLLFVEQHFQIVMRRPGLEEHQKIDELRPLPAVDESPAFVLLAAVGRWRVPGADGKHPDVAVALKTTFGKTTTVSAVALILAPKRYKIPPMT